MFRSIVFRQWKPAQDTLVKIGIVLGVLAMAALLGRWPSPQILLAISLLLAGGVALVVLASRFELGIIALILLAYFERIRIPTGTNVNLNPTFVVTALLIGYWAVRMVVLERNVRLLPSRINAPAITLVIVVALALINGNIDWVPFATTRASLPAQIGSGLLYILSALVILLVGNNLRDLHWLKWLTWTFLACGAGLIFSRIAPNGNALFFSIYAVSGWGAVIWIWLTALPLSQALFNRDLSKKWRAVMLLYVIAMLITNWVYDRKEWVSGWLPPMIVIILMVWLYSWRLGLWCSLSGAVAFFILQNRLASEVMTSTQVYSIDSRAATYPIMFELIKKNPILGLGPANYYYYTPLYSLWGYFVSFNSHNNFVDILAQTGLLGLVAVLWLSAAILLSAYFLFRQARDGFSLAYTAAVLCAIPAVLFSGLLGDWFLPFLYNIGISGFRSSFFVWIFAGGLIVIEKTARREQIADK